MKISDVLKRLRKDGWEMVNQKGSHRQFKHSVKPGKVTVAGKPSYDLHPDTYNSICQQAGWEK